MKPNAATTTEDPNPEETEGLVPPAPAEPSPVPAAPPAPVPSEAANAVALVRAEAAELATIGAQAARLGLSIDVAEAVQKGIRPDALRASILNQLAARSDAAAIAVVPPPKSGPGKPAAHRRQARRQRRQIRVTPQTEGSEPCPC